MDEQEAARRRLTFRKLPTNRQEAHQHASDHAREAEVILVKQEEDPEPLRTGMAVAHAMLAIYYQREGEAL